VIELIDDNSIRDSLRFKLIEGQNILAEAEARQKYWYYTYDPHSTTTNKYIDFHLCGKKVRVCKGAPRTRKTTTCIWDYWSILLREHPVYSNKEVVDKYSKILGYDVPYINPVNEPINIWVTSQSYKMVYRPDGLLDKFLDLAPGNRVKKVTNDNKRNDFIIEIDDGSSITFLSQEQPKDAKSSSVHAVLVDERIDNDMMRRELRMRILDTNGLLTFAQDSTGQDEWAEELSQTAYGQLFEFELNDNIDHLPAEDIERLKTELSDIEKEIYVLGKYKERNTKPVFPETIWSKSNYVEISPKRFNFVNGKLVADEAGIIRIFKEPVPGEKYAIGLDTSKGVGVNAHAGVVLNSETGEQYASFINNKIGFLSLDELIIAPLGYYYNNALVVVEDKSTGMLVLAKLKLYYPNLYFEVKVDSFNKPAKDFGINTNETNKFEMIEQVQDDIVKGKLLIHCSKTKKQLDGYVEVRNGKVTQKGEVIQFRGTKDKKDKELEGSDDDLVSALLLVDRAINKWGYLKAVERNINKVQTIDNLKKIEDDKRIYRSAPSIHRDGGLYSNLQAYTNW
jgi:hypothetical protein